MFIQDEALIYKQYDCLYYAITKNNGKLILKHFYFQDAYPEIKSFFFVNYEYNAYQYHKAESLNYSSLAIQNMELEYIVSLKNIGSTILLFQYIFNYCINYKITIDDIWNKLFLFFHNNYTEINTYQFIYNLLIDLHIAEDDFPKKIEDSIDWYKKTIIDTLVSLNPKHTQYIKKTINNQ